MLFPLANLSLPVLRRCVFDLVSECLMSLFVYGFESDFVRGRMFAEIILVLQIALGSYWSWSESTTTIGANIFKNVFCTIVAKGALK